MNIRPISVIRGRLGDTMQITGRTWKYGDNVNTDVIFPGKYTYTLTERADIAAPCAGGSGSDLCVRRAAGRRDRGRAQLGLRLQPRAGRHLPGLQRRGRGDCRELQPHLLPQRAQQRSAGHCLPGRRLADQLAANPSPSIWIAIKSSVRRASSASRRSAPACWALSRPADLVAYVKAKLAVA